jgi:hypothetical protein
LLDHDVGPSSSSGTEIPNTSAYSFFIQEKNTKISSNQAQFDETPYTNMTAAATAALAYYHRCKDIFSMTILRVLP